MKRLLSVIVFLTVLALAPAAAFERRTPIVEAVARAGPAVVNIRTEQVVKRRSSPFFGFAEPFFEDFFRDLAPPRVYRTESLGSGVIIDPRGYVLTNAHVVEKASRIYVALTEGSRELEATLVGQDEHIDLAVLRIEGERDFPYLPPGRSDDLLVGETVIAIGNPLGLGHSITTGVVSTPHRRLPVGQDGVAVFIQSDALINPGNSGGPLININGELIGINTAIARQAQGIGFAIPIDAARRIADDLIEHGRVQSAFLGVVPGPVGSAFAAARGRGGVLVNAVETDSPAQRAGLHIADVILALDGQSVTSPREFASLRRTYTAGDAVTIRLLRGETTLELTVELAALPTGYALRYARRVFGLKVADGRRGLTVTDVVPNSAAETAGLHPGDLIAEVNGRRIDKREDFAAVIEEKRGQEPLRFLVVRGNRGYYVDLP